MMKWDKNWKLCYICQKPGTAHKHSNSISVMKHGSVSIILWGCFWQRWENWINWGKDECSQMQRGPWRKPSSDCTQLRFCTLRLGQRFTFKHGNDSKHTYNTEGNECLCTNICERPHRISHIPFKWGRSARKSGRNFQFKKPPKKTPQLQKFLPGSCWLVDRTVYLLWLVGGTWVLKRSWLSRAVKMTYVDWTAQVDKRNVSEMHK